MFFRILPKLWVSPFLFRLFGRMRPPFYVTYTLSSYSRNPTKALAPTSCLVAYTASLSSNRVDTLSRSKGYYYRESPILVFMGWWLFVIQADRSNYVMNHERLGFFLQCQTMTSSSPLYMPTTTYNQPPRSNSKSQIQQAYMPNVPCQPPLSLSLTHSLPFPSRPGNSKGNQGLVSVPPSLSPSS